MGLLAATSSTPPNNSQAGSGAIASCVFHANSSDYECGGVSVCQAVRTAQYHDCTYAIWWKGTLVSGNPLLAEDRLIGKSTTT